MRRAFLVLSLFVSLAANGRVISYAPYTNQVAFPAVQNRMNRHFVLFEVPADKWPASYAGSIVVYDSTGSEEPRVVMTTTDAAAPTDVAAREDDTDLAILVTSAAKSSLSIDGGRTWKTIQFWMVSGSTLQGQVDFGGVTYHGRYSALRIGTHDFPFIAALSGTLFAIGRDGTVNPLFTNPVPQYSFDVAGTSRDGSQVLVHDFTGYEIIGLDGSRKAIGSPPVLANGTPDGWIAADGTVFTEVSSQQGAVGLWAWSGSWRQVDPLPAAPPFAPPVPNPQPPAYYAVPTGDYTGWYSVTRTTSATTLTSNSGVQWVDQTAPQVEAIHPNADGSKVVIQVHRPRVSLDNALFKDPAIAVWHRGDPAPKAYDELFLEETWSKGFVHLNVDTLEAGDSFVFDSGVVQPGGSVIISPAPPSAGGGSDVVQEWGVVRASLAQRLVLPGAARTAGAFGSYWLTDVTFYNPSTASVNVNVAYVPNGEVPSAASANSRVVALAPHEIRTIPDVLSSLFEFETGGGALFITPDFGTSINVTSRTYSRSSKGTFGFGMNAIDVYAAASPRFPVSFSGAFLGDNFRTNLVLTDVSGRGTDATIQAWGSFGPSGSSVAAFHAPTFGQQQFNGIGGSIGASSNDTGALVVQPSSGEAVASVFTIDNRTNDSTYFPPDIAVSVVRVIPVVGHLDGANGSKFRSDLYLFNLSSSPKQLTLQAAAWDASVAPVQLGFTLLPNESRIIRDVLPTMFGMTGMARIRFWETGSVSDTSLRVTSRTYTVDADGGTYGFLMPPLNSFQSASAGDTLEILGTTLDSHFRTNLGVVDLTPTWAGNTPSQVHVDIVSNNGAVIDSFDMTLPPHGGKQINDLFRERSLPDVASPVLIRVTTVVGSVGAYGALIDNGTNDPAYFAANLAAKN